MEDNKSAGVPDWNGQVLSGKKKEIFFVPYLTRPHILRHTACTRMAETDLDMKVVQYVMGHANISVTMEVYNHITDRSRIEKEISKMDLVQIM